MSEFRAEDVTVIIPTRDRWQILTRTLNMLENQSALGFEVIVVVDGLDQQVPELPQAAVIRQDKGGPGAARNRGVSETSRPLVLFLGDDILPDPKLVESHLDTHRSDPREQVAVLGRTEWHPSVARGPHNRWLEWSASQFDFAGIRGIDAGWGRFYSSNVSLKRELFARAGGFDESFTFDYEDLDLAYRLHQNGLVLRYQPNAVGQHLHPYDWDALVRRYHSRGEAERQMSEKHDWFEPFFRRRIAAAFQHSPLSVAWPAMATRLPKDAGKVGTRLRWASDVWYHQQLAAPFFGGWNGGDDLADLKEYLGDKFDPDALTRHQALLEEEEMEAPDESTFYKTSNNYLYDLTMFAVWGTKEPYLNVIRRLLPEGGRLLDYGCGIGADGLRLMRSGYELAFADFDNPSIKYLRWRLEHHGLQAPIYDVEKDVPGGFDLAYSFDVIEHVDDPKDFLQRLESRARIVLVNFLEPDSDDTHLHRPLPVRRLLNRATRKGLLFYQRFEGRSHLVAYRSSGGSPSSIVGSLRQRCIGTCHVATERFARFPRRHGWSN